MQKRYRFAINETHQGCYDRNQISDRRCKNWGRNLQNVIENDSRNARIDCTEQKQHHQGLHGIGIDARNKISREKDNCRNDGHTEKCPATQQNGIDSAQMLTNDVYVKAVH